MQGARGRAVLQREIFLSVTCLFTCGERQRFCLAARAGAADRQAAVTERFRVAAVAAERAAELLQYLQKAS